MPNTNRKRTKITFDDAHFYKYSPCKYALEKHKPVPLPQAIAFYDYSLLSLSLERKSTKIPLTISISNAFDIKNRLKADKYQYNPKNKSWETTLNLYRSELDDTIEMFRSNLKQKYQIELSTVAV